MIELKEIIMIFLGTFLTVAIGAIGYFLKDIRSDIKDKLKDQDKAINKVADDLAEFKAILPTRYVMRDDFLRAVANQDYKLDMLAKEMGEVNKNLNKLIGGQTRETT
ncbi:hypothetical protein [Propionispora vibrioides]|uniref:Uncharacterized protein n=1 Tax=Propionispora vibrioides TaxID=112903 RepID=A0A1H8U4C8_9FIRM|nr:hypothetical protein [Propionispora vibrioides]SEO98089.1 hypothetical protein SAMN04490178_10828 [Propionispora vibrioides]